ncbi:Transposase, GSU2180 family [hydrothermal vent metagenome]|uniref:Transposase, GSU2180 family n=1 Tax=hydrothermal vent metagenome TaxID=652676 RepID=A0A3B0Z1H8_9ZZZZ
MAHNNTIFAQLLKFVSRHEFEGMTKSHHVGRKLRKTSRWSQFVALCLGQLSGRHSLRDIESNMNAQANRLYHLGAKPVPRTSLARLNETQPASLYESLFAKLYAKCKSFSPSHKFRFTNKLYSLDASLIDLSLRIFPWAHLALGKSAMKLHVSLDHNGYIPNFATITGGKVSDIAVGRTLYYSKGSIVVFDKGYTDYEWYKALHLKGIFFVTRGKKNATYKIIERRKVDKLKGLTCDQTISLTGTKSKKLVMPNLRRIGYCDPATGQYYDFLTNNFALSAQTIAAIYKERWQVELFFKWIKQNLKIKSFVGNSKNAILTQIWIALCTYLILAYLKFSTKLDASLQTMLRLLQLNLFIRRDLMALLRGDPPPNKAIQNPQMRLL